MAKISVRGEQIRQFILDNVGKHPKDITNFSAKNFGISRQAVNKHIQRLVNRKVFVVRGATRGRRYILRTLDQWEHIYSLEASLEEHLVWRNDLVPRLGHLADNVSDIWHYGFTEMLNNAIEHSSARNINIQLKKTAIATELIIHDDGEGIFKKIQREMELSDERHAVLELSKGKLTSDPDNHKGEGIFFTSRMFDDFRIVSGNVDFSPAQDEVEGWILENQQLKSGTTVFMKLKENTARTTKQVFESFTTGGKDGFTKTVISVRLAQYGEEKLISRSQAKTLVARFDRFKVVILDFEGLETIGQAFADEVFRVFGKQHPEVELQPVNANQEVEQMISRAISSVEP